MMAIFKLRISQSFGACQRATIFDRPSDASGRSITLQDHVAAQHQAQASYYAQGYVDLSLINPATKVAVDCEHIAV
jgi:hypothetical protein